MTERELLETLARARHALALASWGVARAALEETEGKPASGEDAMSSALSRWRAARIALGRAHARWEREAVSTGGGSDSPRSAH